MVSKFSRQDHVKDGSTFIIRQEVAAGQAIGGKYNGDERAGETGDSKD